MMGYILNKPVKTMGRKKCNSQLTVRAMAPQGQDGPLLSSEYKVQQHLPRMARKPSPSEGRSEGYRPLEVRQGHSPHGKWSGPPPTPRGSGPLFPQGGRKDNRRRNEGRASRRLPPEVRMATVYPTRSGSRRPPAEDRVAETAFH